MTQRKVPEIIAARPALPPIASALDPIFSLRCVYCEQGRFRSQTVVSMSFLILQAGI
ncbi:hypothetical protein RP726_06305 [Candidatus Methylospira mobilis]|uniref:hypothetical protein n=1 Tax=Candidatus Methylospira mobilis TaxID=1808979 RepID=UPI0012935CC1|nr:hypothetical protein [Candidatus Methylospira mobilis]WNV06025.1 hypothetical protein RP726_06305 [Candidatus Methylospira mobilis]